MNVFVPLQDILFGDKSILLALCETIITPTDSVYSNNMTILIDYSLKYHKLEELLLWCYEHDYEFGCLFI